MNNSRDNVDHSNDSLSDLTLWLREDVLAQHPLKLWKRFVRGFDTIVGLLASAMAIPLTYRFGELLIQDGLCQGVFNTDCNDDAIRVFQIYNTVVGTLSTAAILGKVSNSLVEQLIYRPSAHEKAITIQQKSDCFFKLVYCLNWFFALASASPESYAAYVTLKNVVHSVTPLFVASDIFTLTSKNNWSARNLGRRFWEFCTIRNWKKHELEHQRVALLEHLASAKEKLANLSETELNEFYQASLSFSSTNAEESEVNQAIYSIIQLGITNNLEATRIKKPIAKTITGYIGSAFAILGAAATYKLGQDGSKKFLTWLTRSEASSIFDISIILGITAYLYRIALGVYASNFTFEKFYDWVASFKRNKIPNTPSDEHPPLLSDLVVNSSNNSRSRKALSFASNILMPLAILLISLGGGTPRVSMTAIAYDNQAWYFVPLCVAAFMAAFPTNYWANHAIANAFFNPNPKRTHIENVITKTHSTLFSMRSECVEELHEITLAPRF